MGRVNYTDKILEGETDISGLELGAMLRSNIQMPESITTYVINHYVVHFMPSSRHITQLCYIWFDGTHFWGDGDDFFVLGCPFLCQLLSGILD